MAPAFPVSVKGVVISQRRVLLGFNSRGEYELLGGRLEADESPERCVAREILEEAGLAVTIGPLLDVWVYQPLPDTEPDRRVLIVTFGCTTAAVASPVVSDEHSEVAFVSLDALDGLPLPDGYRRSIARWVRHLADRDASGP